MKKDNLKIGQYIEFFNPPKYEYFPVRITNIDSEGIDVIILFDKSKKTFSNYFIENYSYRRPFISQKLIENCGFKKVSNFYYEKDDFAIIECYRTKIENDKYSDRFTKFFGFKVINKSDVEGFVEIFKGVLFEMDLEEFKTNYNTVFDIEDLFSKFKEFGINNVDFDDVVLNS